MLKNRLITALLLGAAFLGALFFLPDLPWALFLLLFILVGAWEWGGLAGYALGGRLLFLGLTSVAGMLLLPDLPMFDQVRQWGAMLLVVAAAPFWLLIVPVWLLRRWHIRESWLSALIGWLVLLPPWIALVDLRRIGPELVLALMVTVWLADSAAYFFGKRFGQRKLAPEISPGKTWEGLMGALVAVALFAGAVCWWFGLSVWFVVGFLAITVLSVIGDLYESLIKRQAGKKDSGILLPGHGGVLDRIDGLTPTLPLAAFYIYIPLYSSILSS